METDKDLAANNESGMRTVKRFLWLYITIAAVFLLIGPKVFSSNWVSSSDFHACIEISSSFIAIMASIACIIYFFGLESRYFLIIGLGFLICGSEDLVHGIFGFKRLFEGTGIDWAADIKKFIPGTYVAGRSFLAAMIIAAALLENRAGRTGNVKQEAIRFSIFAFILGGGVTALAFTLPLPDFIFPENIISRPVDFISAMLFITAFFLIFKRFQFHRDIFSGMLLACILLNIGGQVYMSFSKQLFDVFFDTAHWANILSYTMPVLGITIESFSEIKKTRLATELRRMTEVKLNEEKMFIENTFDSLVDIFYLFDFEGKPLRWNKSLSKVIGYSDDEISEMNLTDFFSQEDVQRMLEAVIEVKTEGFARIEAPLLLKDGRQIQYEFTGTVVKDSEGKEIGFSGIARDITARSRIENELIEQRENILKQNWLKSGLAELGDRMRGNQNVFSLTRNIITCIAEYLDLPVGVIYVSDDKGIFHLNGSYASGTGDILESFNPGEGLSGQAVLQKKRIVITDVPDNYMKIDTGLGELKPRNIFITPIILNEEVMGIIELGAIEDITDDQKEFLDIAGETIAIAIDAALARTRVGGMFRDQH